MYGVIFEIGWQSLTPQALQVGREAGCACCVLPLGVDVHPEAQHYPRHTHTSPASHLPHPRMTFAALQAEVRRVLQPLRAGADGDSQEQLRVLRFLSFALNSSKLRAMMLEQVSGRATLEMGAWHLPAWHMFGSDLSRLTQAHRCAADVQQMCNKQQTVGRALTKKRAAPKLRTQNAPTQWHCPVAGASGPV